MSAPFLRSLMLSIICIVSSLPAINASFIQTPSFTTSMQKVKKSVQDSSLSPMELRKEIEALLPSAQHTEISLNRIKQYARSLERVLAHLKNKDASTQRLLLSFHAPLYKEKSVIPYIIKLDKLVGKPYPTDKEVVRALRSHYDKSELKLLKHEIVNGSSLLTRLIVGAHENVLVPARSHLPTILLTTLASLGAYGTYKGYGKVKEKREKAAIVEADSLIEKGETGKALEVIEKNQFSTKVLTPEKAALYADFLKQQMEEAKGAAQTPSKIMRLAQVHKKLQKKAGILAYSKQSFSTEEDSEDSVESNDNELLGIWKYFTPYTYEIVTQKEKIQVLEKQREEIEKQISEIEYVPFFTDSLPYELLKNDDFYGKELDKAEALLRDSLSLQGKEKLFEKGKNLLHQLYKPKRKLAEVISSIKREKAVLNKLLSEEEVWHTQPLKTRESSVRDAEKKVKKRLKQAIEAEKRPLAFIVEEIAAQKVLIQQLQKKTEDIENRDKASHGDKEKEAFSVSSLLGELSIAHYTLSLLEERSKSLNSALINNISLSADPLFGKIGTALTYKIAEEKQRVIKLCKKINDLEAAEDDIEEARELRKSSEGRLFIEEYNLQSLEDIRSLLYRKNIAKVRAQAEMQKRGEETVEYQGLSLFIEELEKEIKMLVLLEKDAQLKNWVDANGSLQGKREDWERKRNDLWRERVRYHQGLTADQINTALLQKDLEAPLPLDLFLEKSEHPKTFLEAEELIRNVGSQVPPRQRIYTLQASSYSDLNEALSDPEVKASLIDRQSYALKNFYSSFFQKEYIKALEKHKEKLTPPPTSAVEAHRSYSYANDNKMEAVDYKEYEYFLRKLLRKIRGYYEEDTGWGAYFMSLWSRWWGDRSNEQKVKNLQDLYEKFDQEHKRVFLMVQGFPQENVMLTEEQKTLISQLSNQLHAHVKNSSRHEELGLFGFDDFENQLEAIIPKKGKLAKLKNELENHVQSFSTEQAPIDHDSQYLKRNFHKRELIREIEALTHYQAPYQAKVKAILAPAYKAFYDAMLNSSTLDISQSQMQLKDKEEVLKKIHDQIAELEPEKSKIEKRAQIYNNAQKRREALLLPAVKEQTKANKIYQWLSGASLSISEEDLVQLENQLRYLPDSTPLKFEDNELKVYTPDAGIVSQILAFFSAQAEDVTFTKEKLNKIIKEYKNLSPRSKGKKQERAQLEGQINELKREKENEKRNLQEIQKLLDASIKINAAIRERAKEAGVLERNLVGETGTLDNDSFGVSESKGDE